MSNPNNIGGINRLDFPALDQKIHGHNITYLDNAATTLKPNVVIEAINQHYSKESANVHRGIHFLSAQGTQKYEATREAVKNLIHAPYLEEVIFTKGTTDSINLVAHSWSQKYLSEGDQILVSTMEHHSNIVPWQLIAETKGAHVIEIPINDQGEIIELELKALLKSGKVKMVAMAQISNTLGTINNVKTYASWAHEVGAHFLVDGAQSIAHMKVDVQDLDVDFFTFSAHKMFGPTGVGILWGKKDLLEAMPPYQGGGAMIKEVSFKGTSYNELPEKFEAGTPHIAGVIAFKAAIDYLLSLGLDKVAQAESELLKYATEQLSKIRGLKIIGTAKNKASVISFIIQGAHPHDLGMILDEQGVAIRTGHHCTQPLMRYFDIPATARASFCFYNNKEDVDQLTRALTKAQELL